MNSMIKRYLKGLVQGIIKHNIGSLAAIIAFFGFSSLLPLLTLLLYVGKLLIPTSVIASFLRRILESYIPSIPTGQHFAQLTLMHLTSFGAHIGIMGVIGLLWGTVGGFVTLQQVLDTICDTKHRRSFLKQYVVGFLMMGILLVLTLCSSLVTAVSPTFVSRLIGNNDFTTIIQTIQLAGHIAFPFILMATCFCCYRILPSHSLGTVPSVVGSAIATLLLYTSRALFVTYTHHLRNYQSMYGTMTFVMLLTFWIYVACIILLFGAEVTVTLHRLNRVRDTGGSSHRERIRAKPFNG